MQLTGTGIWAHQLRYGDPGAIAEYAAELDELGYDALWIPDVGGDVLASCEVLLGAASRAVATGILNIWMHEPAAVAAHIAGWSGAWRDRFVLGLGVSHAPLIDHGNPGRYTKPFSKMYEYLDGLDAAPQPIPVDARLLAALGPRMLELFGAIAPPARFPYFVPPEHVLAARERLNPTSLIAVELAVVLDTDPSTARTTARRHTAVYVTLPNYTNNLRRFGYEDHDFADMGSDRLIDAIVAWGDFDTIAARVQLMRDAGADHVCVQVIRPDDETPRADWRELAGVLL